jgi:hypothetical protein
MPYRRKSSRSSSRHAKRQPRKRTGTTRVPSATLDHATLMKNRSADAYQKLSLAGLRVAAMIESDDGADGPLSGDGPETIPQLGPLLLKLNRYGGIATTNSQGMDSDHMGRQRPFIELLVHESRMNIIGALGFVDNIVVLTEGALPLSWLQGSKADFDEYDAKYPSYMQRRRAIAPDMYVRVFTSYPHSEPLQADLENFFYGIRAGDLYNKDMMYSVCFVCILWTKTSDVESFVRTVTHILDNPPPE